MKRMITALLLAGMLMLCGCQPTPAEPIVVQKDELKVETAEETQAAAEKPAQNEWCYEKEYNDGKKLNVKATIRDNGASGVPVVSLEERRFGENPELMRKIVNTFCDESYDVRQNTGTVTKEILQTTIHAYQEYKKEFEAKGDTDELRDLQEALEKIMKQYQEAPSSSDMPKPDYELQKTGEYYQLSLIAINDENVIDITFADEVDSKGSDMRIQNCSVDFPYDQEDLKFVTEEQLKDDAQFIKGKETVDAFLKEIGADHLQLNVATNYKDGKTYSYYYTREVNGYKDDYIFDFFGSMQSENDVVMDLWGGESMRVQIMDGEIIDVKWSNLSDATIENENVKIISFEEAKEIFLKQIDRMLLPNIEDGDESAVNDYIRKNTAVNITKIELGLTKLLMKDSKDSYKLIPTWAFYGYEAGSGHEIDEKRGAESCFVTINAIDGSIVNHRAMN